VNTKGSEIEEVTIESGHAYLDKLANGETIPSPEVGTLDTLKDLFHDYGIETNLIAIIDDTPKDVENLGDQQKTELAENYLSKWEIDPDSYHWESEAIDVWKQEWNQHKDLDYATAEDSKWCDLTCAALDTAMTAEKLSLTDYTSIPGADFAVTQHDENYPLAPGTFSSFQDYDNQEESHELQKQLHEEDVIEVPTFQDNNNLEFNPQEVDNKELEEALYHKVIA
jgi:hypothetical protein